MGPVRKSSISYIYHINLWFFVWHQQVNSWVTSVLVGGVLAWVFEAGLQQSLGRQTRHPHIWKYFPQRNYKARLYYSVYTRLHFPFPSQQRKKKRVSHPKGMGIKQEYKWKWFKTVQFYVNMNDYKCDDHNHVKKNDRVFILQCSQPSYYVRHHQNMNECISIFFQKGNFLEKKKWYFYVKFLIR